MEPCLFCAAGSVSYHFPVSAREGLQRYQRLSRGAIQSHRNSDRADAGIGVSGERTNLVGPHYIFLSPLPASRRGGKQRDPDLASVASARRVASLLGIRRPHPQIGFVRQQDNGLSASGTPRKVSVRSAVRLSTSFTPASQKRAPFALNRGRLALPVPGCRRIGSAWVTYTGSVLKSWFPMIAHKPCGAVIWRRMVSGMVRAANGRFCLVSEQRHGNKIPSQHDQVGMETV